jgi:hypothetical protein
MSWLPLKSQAGQINSTLYWCGSKSAKRVFKARTQITTLILMRFIDALDTALQSLR